jgi:hypothetical protein
MSRVSGAPSPFAACPQDCVGMMPRQGREQTPKPPTRAGRRGRREQAAKRPERDGWPYPGEPAPERRRVGRTDRVPPGATGRRSGHFWAAIGRGPGDGASGSARRTGGQIGRSGRDSDRPGVPALGTGARLGRSGRDSDRPGVPALGTGARLRPTRRSAAGSDRRNLSWRWIGRGWRRDVNLARGRSRDFGRGGPDRCGRKIGRRRGDRRDDRRRRVFQRSGGRQGSPQQKESQREANARNSVSHHFHFTYTQKNGRISYIINRSARPMAAADGSPPSRCRRISDTEIATLCVARRSWAFPPDRRFLAVARKRLHDLVLEPPNSPASTSARLAWPRRLMGFEPTTFCMAISPVSETSGPQIWQLAGIS